VLFVLTCFEIGYIQGPFSQHVVLTCGQPCVVLFNIPDFRLYCELWSIDNEHWLKLKILVLWLIEEYTTIWSCQAQNLILFAKSKTQNLCALLKIWLNWIIIDNLHGHIFPILHHSIHLFQFYLFFIWKKGSILIGEQLSHHDGLRLIFLDHYETAELHVVDCWD